MNLSTLTKLEGVNVNPGIGLQTSLGLQISKNFGVDLGYSQMNQSGSSDGIKADLKESGFEIGINGTFKK